jgi:Cu(I)/Ag(I) efflux system membrane fusion protein
VRWSSSEFSKKLRDFYARGVLSTAGTTDKRKTAMNIKAISASIIATASLLMGMAAHAADNPALSESAKSVYTHYLKIQGELAKDSLAGVGENANAIAKAVRGDETKTLPPAVAEQAETVAKAKDIAAAREAFKPLSKSLIKYLADNKVPKGTYYEVYCPMARASWLQANKDVNNPYMGKEMAGCGIVKD